MAESKDNCLWDLDVLQEARTGLKKEKKTPLNESKYNGLDNAANLPRKTKEVGEDGGFSGGNQKEEVSRPERNFNWTELANFTEMKESLSDGGSKGSR